MKKLFRPRNLLVLFGLGIIVGVVLSKKNSAPAPTYPDPWATPATTSAPTAAETPDGEAADPSTNGASAETEAADV